MTSKNRMNTKDIEQPLTPLESGVDARLQSLGMLGKGGMGDVLKMRQRDLKRVVAVKVIQGQSWKDPQLSRRFFTEAKVTAQLTHPNIIPVYGVEWTSDGRPAFSMKLVNGQTFLEYVDDCGRNPGVERTSVPRRLDHFLKVCDALAYSHDRGVLHRDIKPDNLMLGAFNEVYVLDWGIAKVLGSADDTADGKHLTTEDPTKTAKGDIFGTPSYMSPEQAMGMPLTPASDQYSLGLVLQELVTLTRANPGTTSESAWRCASDAERAPVMGDGGRKVSADLKAIIQKATAVKPKKRYSNVGAFADDIRRFLGNQEVLANPDGRWRRLTRWAQTRPVLLLGAVASSLLVATLAALFSVVVLLGMSSWAHYQERKTAAIVHTADRQGHRIDAVLIRHQSTLENLSQMIEHLWEQGVVSDGQIYDRKRLGAGDVPADWGHSERYGYPSTFTDMLVLFVPGTDRAAVEPGVRRLLPVIDAFRETALRSHSPMSVHLPEEEIHRLFSESGVPIAWLYIGLEDGVLINWPRNNEYGVEYDPRKRPWYRENTAAAGARFGTLYQGASGFSMLLPCNRLLQTESGEVFGVAGLDMALDTVIEMLQSDDESVIASYLVDSAGRIVVSTEQEGLNLGRGVHGNKALERQLLPYPLAAERIARGDESGWVDIGSEIITFDRLDSVDWYLVTVVNDAWF